MHYAHPYLGGIFSEGEISSKKNCNCNFTKYFFNRNYHESKKISWYSEMCKEKCAFRFQPVVISLKDQKNIYLGNKTLKSQRPQVKTFLRISLFSLFCPSKFYDNHDAIFDAIVSNSCQSHCKYIQWNYSGNGTHVKSVKFIYSYLGNFWGKNCSWTLLAEACGQN